MVGRTALAIAFALLVTVAGMAGIATATPVAGTPPGAEGYAYPEWLADAGWLQERLDDEHVTIVALTPAEDFAAGHIPGAAQIAWQALEVLDTREPSLESWRAEAERLLTELGVEHDDTVVVYDGGTFHAPRLWWVLHYLGHEDVRLLNGGLAAWEAAGGPVETGESTAEPAVEPYAGEPDDAALAGIEEVEAAFADSTAVFVDARRADEYAEGHIPGAVNVLFTDNAEADEPKYWKGADDLRAIYEGLGVTPDKPVIAYCTSGVRSSATYFALKQLGYEDVSLFSGSFAEWSSDPDRPVTTGDQP